MTTSTASAEAVPPRASQLRLAFSRSAAFWTVGMITASLLAASSAPSPLYPVFQADFGFSALTLTGVFAVYVLALLLMLLTVGRLSDFVGRRPVLVSALVLNAAAMAVFFAAEGTGWLIMARILQGLATGAATGVLGAYMLDLQPAGGSRLGSLVNSVAPTSGLALGAIGTGVLVQFAPYPTRLVFAVLTVWFLVLAIVVAALPETVRRLPGALAALRPRVAIPVAARGAFLRATPLMIATWALGGLMLSVGGSLLGEVFGVTDHALVGLVVGGFAGAGAGAAVLARNLDPDRMARYGTLLLATGTLGFLAGLLTSSLTIFVIAALTAGAGFGSGSLGALRAVTQHAQPHERAALLSAVFVVSYLAFSIPAVIAGVLITHAGLRDTAIGYGTFVAALSVGTAIVESLRRTSAS